MEEKNDEVQKSWFPIVCFSYILLDGGDLLNSFLLSLGVAFVFYLKNGNGFYFDFFKESIYSLSKAIPGGSILGSGLWIKARLQARKDNKTSIK